MMDKLPSATVYETFTYHVALLKDFSAEAAGDDIDSSRLSFSGRRPVRQNSFSGGRLMRDAQGSSNSVRSMRSVGNKRGKNSVGRRSRKGDNKPSSVGDGNLFAPKQSDGGLTPKEGGRMLGPRPKASALQRNASVAF